MIPDELINGLNGLVSLPDAVARANELLESEHANAEAIGEVIAHDPALAAQLLKLVNSAFYSLPTPIHSISRAITLIGNEELRALIMSSTATQLFNKVPAGLIDMNSFWQRSVYCGLINKKLSTYGTDSASKGETAFLIGLLHAVGQLVLLMQRPEQARTIYHLAESGQRKLYEVEQQQLGFTTAELGARLLQNWHLPAMIWQPIANQHLLQSPQDYPAMTATLHQAIAITDCVEPELKSAEPISLDAFSDIQFNDKKISAAELSTLAMDANLESFEVLGIINPLVTNIY